MEGVVRAKTQISHNGGEINGNMATFRQMKVIQPDGTYVEVPHVSGNSIRGKLRDVGAKMTLDMLGENDAPHKVGLSVFQLMFSGGSLTAGNTEGDIDKYNQLRENLTHIALFGGAWGNAILAGQMKVNPLIPIAKETAHIIPSQFVPSDVPSVFTYRQMDMYTRKENANDTSFEDYLEKVEDEKIATTQMIYYIETLAAGTPFYWKVVLEDVNPQEFDYFITLMQKFKEIPVVGGKSAVGFGQLELEDLTWRDITKEGETLTIENETTQSLYVQMLRENKSGVRAFLKMI